MKILGVIPARYSSSRFPGKPLAEICGKPMVYWVYHQCQKIDSFYKVYVATDDERIIDVCNYYNINVIKTSSEHKTGTDRLGEVASLIEADFYVNIQGDEPLIEPAVIESVINHYKSNKDARVINTMTKINNMEDVMSPTVVKVVTTSANKGIYLSRSAIPYPKNNQEVSYYKHLGLYGLSQAALLYFAKSARTKVEIIEDIEMLRFLENGIEIDFVTVNSETIGVDIPEDINKVEKIMKNRRNINEKY